MSEQKTAKKATNADLKEGTRVILPATDNADYGDPLPEERGVVLEEPKDFTVIIEVDPRYRTKGDDGLREIAMLDGEEAYPIVLEEVN